MLSISKVVFFYLLYSTFRKLVGAIAERGTMKDDPLLSPYWFFLVFVYFLADSRFWDWKRDGKVRQILLLPKNKKP